MLQYFDGYGYHGTSFEQTYRCYPASFIEKVGMLSFFFPSKLYVWFSTVRSVFVLHFLASVVFSHTPLFRIFFTFLIVEKCWANFYFKFEKRRNFSPPPFFRKSRSFISIWKIVFCFWIVSLFWCAFLYSILQPQLESGDKSKSSTSCHFLR